MGRHQDALFKHSACPVDKAHGSGHNVRFILRVLTRYDLFDEATHRIYSGGGRKFHKSGLYAGVTL